MRYVRLRAARFNAGMTSEELAEAAGVHRVTLSRWENGHASPTLEQLRLMAEALGVSVHSLIDDEVAA